jgi:hexokinase
MLKRKWKSVEMFLKQNNFSYEIDDFQKEIDRFLSEMNHGLNKKGMLSMIPTYIKGDMTPIQNEKIIVVDAGGTNLRIAFVEVEKNETLVSNILTTKLPGVEYPIAYSEFMDKLARNIEPYLKESQIIAFSMAQEIMHTEKLDGYITSLSKEVKIKGIENQWLAKGLKEHLSTLGYNRCKVLLINDTVGVACALLQRREEFSSFVGLVLGTGTNSSYLEHNHLILNKNNKEKKCMFVNTESGNYCPSILSDFDIMYHKSTTNPQTAIFEKMVSGRYLGELFYTILIKACEYGLFSKQFTKSIQQIKKINTKEMSKFYNDRNSENVYRSICKRKKDLDIAYYICDKLICRSANLIAVNIVALSKKTVKSREGAVCCIVEGSTFFGLKGFQQMVEAKVKSYTNLNEIKIFSIQDAAIKGIGNIGLSMTVIEKE